MVRTNALTRIGVVVTAISLSACTRDDAQPSGPAGADAASQAIVEAALPEPVNGWIEHPLKPGTIRLQANGWRTDTIEIPVPANGGELEFKLAIKKDDALVYSVDYGTLDDPSAIVAEFHGHTEKRSDGVGDLMFYSKTGGAAQSGQFVAPWDGVHGWYLKNESSKDATVTLKLAGYYELVRE